MSESVRMHEWCGLFWRHDRGRPPAGPAAPRGSPNGRRAGDRHQVELEPQRAGRRWPGNRSLDSRPRATPDRLQPEALQLGT